MRVEFGQVNEDHTQSELKWQPGGGLGVRVEWVCKRDGHTEEEEGEVDDGKVEGGRDDDEGHVAFGEEEAESKAKSKGVGKAKGLGEGDASIDVIGGVDDESGRDGDRDAEKGDGVVGDGESLMIGRRRDRNMRTEALEGFGFRKAIDGLIVGGR
ncbi:hypothetical protein CRG98_021276 [Punica granatum]|uniref:Uncharacterized protein n=1 Tax=Punica granatum TaxID=22663 RepID=A0A2I0JPW1_PUNGR|nr:hypothetical protein CRG98_021276 [Punica granatum]